MKWNVYILRNEGRLIKNPLPIMGVDLDFYRQNEQLRIITENGHILTTLLRPKLLSVYIDGFIFEGFEVVDPLMKQLYVQEWNIQPEKGELS